MWREQRVIGCLVTVLAALSTTTLPLQAASPSAPPVVAESLVLQPGSEGVDSYVDSGHPSDNFGALTWYMGIGLPSREALVRFDLSAIPSGSTLVSAVIDLWAEFRAGTITFAPLASDWSESLVTWNTRPGTTAPAVTHPIVTCSFGCIQSFEIADVVRYAIDHPEIDFGMKITADSPYVGWLMASSDHGTTTSRPKLTVQYVPGGVPVQAGCWAGVKAIYR